MSELGKTNASFAGSRFEASIPYLAPIAVASIAIALASPATLIVILTDGAWPAAIILSAAGWGAWPAKSLTRNAKNGGQEFAVATAIGMGLMAAMALSLGVMGLLSRTIALVLVGLGLVLGISRLAVFATGNQVSVGNTTEPALANSTAKRQQAVKIAVLLPLAVPIFVALAGATLPPGLLWREEAGGYDVLEYHLQVQREYFERGRIEFLPHNVYASFPQQIEIFYLLLMHLTGSAVDAAIPAQVFHVLLGGLAVAAFAAWLPAGWPRLCGVVTLGCTPWLAYLGCLAYVENGVLFFAAVAFGIIADWIRGERLALASSLVAGLCAGMAGGCKYTAIVFVGVAAALCALVFMQETISRKCRVLGVFFTAGLVGISPWLIRNIAFTGNPVYPFAYSQLGGTGWSEEQAVQWSRGHALSTGRARTAWGELVFGMFGGFERPQYFTTPFGVLPLGFVAGMYFLISRGTGARPMAYWLSLATLIAVGWAAATQVAGRLAVPVVIPLAALIANLSARYRSAGIGVAMLGAIVGAALVYGTWSHANHDFQRRVGVSIGELAGQSELFVQNHPYNAILPADSRLYLVGDAAVFYVQRRMNYFTAFNRDPWLEYSAHAEAGASVEWLRDCGITHVVFNWNEIERLRRTYGFSDRATRAWAKKLGQAGLLPIATPSGWAASLNGIDIYSVTAGQSTGPSAGPTNHTDIGGSNILASVRSQD